MKKTAGNLRLAALITLIGAALVFAVAFGKPKPEPRRPEPLASPEVDVVEAKIGERSLVIRSQGTVVPKRTIGLVTQVAGLVTAVGDNFAAGGFFTNGETLVQVDPRDYEIQLIQAKSRLADARQALALEKGRALQAKREWRDLGNREANDLFLRIPQLEAAEAAVAAAEADVRQAQLNLERTRLSVPFDGRVESIDVNIGEYLSPGRTVATVFATDVLEVRLSLTANQVRLLRLGGPADSRPAVPVTLTAAYGGEEFQWRGRLVRTEARVDTQSRLFYAVAEIENALNLSGSDSTDRLSGDNQPGNSGRPPLEVGMFVRAEIHSPPYGDIVSLPKTALYEKNQLLTLGDENRLRFRQVDVLQSDTEEILVRGLDGGERVLVDPPGYVSEGMHFEPRFRTEEG